MAENEINVLGGYLKLMVLIVIKNSWDSMRKLLLVDHSDSKALIVRIKQWKNGGIHQSEWSCWVRGCGWAYFACVVTRVTM